MANFKLGRRKKKLLLRTPSLSDFLAKASEWEPVPVKGWEFALPAKDLEMLGNDQYGDCGPAGAMHLIQTSTYNSGKKLHGTLQQTLDLYSAVGGFNINAAPNPDGSNPTDNGIVLTDLLSYWKNTGIAVTDSNGKTVIDKIVGWASLDLTSIAQYRYACYIFGGTYLGINCPDNYLQDTNFWTYDPTSPIAGGHCIYGPGESSANFDIQSWGLNIRGKWSALLNTLDEGYIVIRENWLNNLGKTPSGLDLNGLVSAAKTV